MSKAITAPRTPGSTSAPTTAQGRSENRRIVRLLGRFTAGHRRSFVLGFVMLVAEMLTALADGLPLALLLDYLIDPTKNPDAQTLVRQWAGITLPTLASPLVMTVGLLAIALVVIAMINSLADSLAEIYLAKGGRLLGYNIRVALYSHLQRLSLGFYNQQRTGDLLARVTSDVTAIEDFTTASLSDMVGGFLLVGGTFAILFYKSPQMALVALLIVPVLALVSNYFSKRVKAASKKQRAREGDLAASAQEMLTSIRVVQTYGRGTNQLERFAQYSRKTLASALEAAGIQARFSFVVKVLESLVIAGILGLGVYLNQISLLQLGTLVFLVRKIDDMFKPTRKIIKEWNTLGKVYASVERIGELFDRQPAVADAPNAVPAPRFRGYVEFRDVSFAYQADPGDEQARGQPRLALHKLNLSIAPDEVVALVGPSGAGKSTIVQLLPRLYDPHVGQVRIDGRDIRSYTLESLRAQMSVVLQDTVLFTGTVADNIAYGCDNASREDVIAAAMQASAHEFIEKLPQGYDTVLGERAANLSGGQRQRIAIARAFIRNTPILILDEPTTGLDAESTDLVLLALQSLMRGKTTIIISHDLNLIRNADKIVVIKAGQIEEMGTHRALLQRQGLYANLYAKQFGASAAQPAADEAVAPEPAAPEPPAEISDEPAPVARRRFETMLLQMLPQPVSSAAFADLLPEQEPQTPSEPAPPPMPVATNRSSQRVPVAKPAPPIADAPAPARSIFRTSLMQTLPPVPAPALEPAPAPAPDERERHAAAAHTEVPHTSATISISAADLAAIGARLTPSDLDPLRSAALLAELPTIAQAFDADAMREQLQAALFQLRSSGAATATIERCTVGQAVYVPGDSCLVRYKLQIRSGTGHRLSEALVTGRVFPDPVTATIFLRSRLAPVAKIVRGRPEIAVFASPIAVIEPLNMAVYVFPIDGELPTLAAATDPQRMLDVFRALPSATFGAEFMPQECSVEVVQYRRQHRCVLRYQVLSVRPNSSTIERRIVYGKIADDPPVVPPAAVVAAMRAEVLSRPEAPQVVLPRVLGVRSDLHLALLEGIPGTPRIAQLLQARIKSMPEPDGSLTLEAALATSARIVRALHAAPIALGPRRTLTDAFDELQTTLATIQPLAPQFGAHCQAWLDRIAAFAEESDALPRVFCHGDYTLTQLLFDGNQCGLVDFDTVCQAEPALDVGHYLAYLRFAIQKAQPAADASAHPLAEHLCALFLESYLTAHPGDHNDAWLRSRIAIYEIVSLLRMALRSWQQFKLAKLEHVIVVLEERMRCLR